MTRKEAERQEAVEKLRSWFKPGDTVFTTLRHVSRSGMTRHIGVVVLRDGVDLYPNYAIAAACDYRLNKNGDGLVVGGCGMDMGFALVYDLSRVLFPDGFDCTGEGCPSNDHSNGDRDYSPHRHTGDGGYALKQRWL